MSQPSTQIQARSGSVLRGETRVPGDKSLSHRALILGALASGTNRIRGWLAAGDTLATLNAIQSLGLVVRHEGDTLTFDGGQLTAPSHPIDCVNAGTAMRLLAGLLAGQTFESVLDGSEQLRLRPMRRIVEPLGLMGANIQTNDGRAPLRISPTTLQGIDYAMPIASAQVKSAVLLAGFHARHATTIVEPGPSRDHTERMLFAMGAALHTSNGNGRRKIELDVNHGVLKPLDMTIPGDISSAAFLITAATLLPGSHVRVVDIGLNPTRTGTIDILTRMGAKISTERAGTPDYAHEPAGALRVRSHALQATRIAGNDIVRAIDELPVLAVAATQAEGQTHITDASELRFKEVDRISLLVRELRKMGADIEELPDGMIIAGPTRLQGAHVSSHGDHRLGMALAVAGLVAKGETQIEQADCIDDSFPHFVETLAGLGADISR